MIKILFLNGEAKTLLFMLSLLETEFKNAQRSLKKKLCMPKKDSLVRYKIRDFELNYLI